MAWQEPKTNWGQDPDENVLSSDFNRIEGNIKYAMDLVVSGKQLIKQAIVDKGGNVIAEVPTFQELADGVRGITSSIGTTDASAADIISGKQAVSQNKLIIGTMPDRGAINSTITTQGGQIIVPAGYHDGSGIVKAQITNLIASNIKAGINVGGVVGNYNISKIASFETPNNFNTTNSYTTDFTPVAVICIPSTSGGFTKLLSAFLINSFPWSGNELIYESSRDKYLIRVTLSGRTLSFTFSGTETSGKFIALG